MGWPKLYPSPSCLLSKETLKEEMAGHSQKAKDRPSEDCLGPILQPCSRYGETQQMRFHHSVPGYNQVWQGEGDLFLQP